MSDIKKNGLILWIFCVIFFIYQYGVKSAIPSVLNGELQEHFSVGPEKLGQILCVLYASYTIMQLPAGMIVDNFSAKIIAVVSFLCVSMGIITLVSSDNFLMGCLSQAIIGFGGSFSFVLLMKITNDYFPREKVSIMSGIAVSCGALGPVMFNLLIASFSKTCLWKNIVICVGLFGFLLSVLLFFLVRNTKTLPEKKKEDGSIGDSLKIILTKPYVMIGIFSMTVLGPINAFSDAWGLSYLTVFYGISKVEATSAISSVFFGFVVGCPLFAWIADRVQSFKKPMIIGCFLTLLVLATMIFIKTNVVVLGILSFLLGLFGSCQFLAFPCALSLAPKNLKASASGLVNMFTMLGGTLIIPIVGAIFERSNNACTILDNVHIIENYQTAFVVLIASFLVAICVICLVRDTYKS